MPTKGVDASRLVPAEYKISGGDLTPQHEVDEEWVQPSTGSSRRYVLGDRFHNAAEPHKSKLCRYHDINLCSQADALKTSYQESINHSKNSKRLRSACVQGFNVHFFYNYLMDFYHNERIIQKQLTELQKSLKDGDVIGRDQYFRFKVVKNNYSSS